MKSHEKINQTIETSLKNLITLVDVNTVVGDKINLDNNNFAIPISKVSVAYLTGGGEYGKIGIFGSNKNLPYSVGNGAIVNIKPSGFLIKDKNSYKIINLEASPIEKTIDKISNIFENINEDVNNEEN